MADYSPIIIVGAGRSGTKLLRSILSAHEGLICFPREINYIWRYGNAGFPTDELKPEHAAPEIINYIQKRFSRFNTRNRKARVVEKTCANVLRVEFVHQIFPDAFIIHLIRDGRAVSESARRRWQAPPEPRYLLEKARWIPYQDIPFYLLRYLKYQFGRITSRKKTQSSWGPRFNGIDRLVAEKELIEVCGIQWKTCVRAAEEALKRLPSGQVISVRYEDLIADPVEVAKQLFSNVGLGFPSQVKDFIKLNVRGEFKDKWRDVLTKGDLHLLMPHIEDELNQLGYEV